MRGSGICQSATLQKQLRLCILKPWLRLSLHVSHLWIAHDYGAKMELVLYTDEEYVSALISVIGTSRWEAVAMAKGYSNWLEKRDTEAASRIMYDSGIDTLRRSRELVGAMAERGFLAALSERVKTGSAENPITKLFPATITEYRFIELLDALLASRPGLSYSDDREDGHTLRDFTLSEDDLELPVNVKNAGTRFEQAANLVGLQPNDCIPIPAYKAHAAVESVPNMLYVVSVDYGLIGRLEELLPRLFNQSETIVWYLLNNYGGSRVRDAEDSFIFNTVRGYWERFKEIAGNNPFYAISARKAIRVLQTMPRRTPGIGLRAWGTGASAEVNVHVSIEDDMTPWVSIGERIQRNGIQDVIAAVNRRRTEEVYDPEI